MSLFTKIFGRGKRDAPPTASEAIQKLKETELILTKKQDFLEQKVESEIAIARKNGAKNKRVALEALKRKKRHENQLKQLDATLSTIEFQRESLENAHSNKEVMRTLEIAAKALKGIHADMDVEDVHNIMDEVAEQREITQEIQDALASGGFSYDIDDDELERELEDLEEGDLTRELTQLGPVQNTSLPVSDKDEGLEDEELRALEQWNIPEGREKTNKKQEMAA